MDRSIGFSSCAYTYQSIEILSSINCTNDPICEIEWPCEIREYWHEILPFINFSKIFLLYGTIFICIVGFLLNCISLAVLILSGIGKKGSGIYLVALAICDSGNLIFNYSVGVTREYNHAFNQLFLESEWLCRFHGVFVDIFQLISAWIVVIFTIEKCFVLRFSYKFSGSHIYHYRIFSTLWLSLMTLFSLSKLFLTGFEKDSSYGYEPCKSSRIELNEVGIIRIALQTWIPTVLVALFSTLMFSQLRKIRKGRKVLMLYEYAKESQKSKDFDSNQSKVKSYINKTNHNTPVLIAVSLAFLILVLPLGTVQTMELFWELNKINYSLDEPWRTQYINWRKTKILLKYIRSFFFGFYQINFAINFLLQCIFGQDFRDFISCKVKDSWDAIIFYGCSLHKKSFDLQRGHDKNLGKTNSNSSNNESKKNKFISLNAL